MPIHMWNHVSGWPRPTEPWFHPSFCLPPLVHMLITNCFVILQQTGLEESEFP